MELAEKISEKLGLTFINEEESSGNVCLANSDELRPEFKETFTLSDMLYYELAILNPLNIEDKNKSLLALDLVPKDRNSFWDLVSLGKKINQIQL